ncbi:zinc finger domain-containing protein [Streptomyces mirabilis]|uniref:zinc finger domain-containing protein n=1 Tax=Streptomyces mirabilis TaxID=68239 RepID=UPI0033F5ADC7
MKLRRPPAQRLHELRTWARTVACCPTCQVTPGTPCHRNGIPLPFEVVHAARYQEAEATAA